MNLTKFHDAQIAELVKQTEDIAMLHPKRYEFNSYAGIFLAIFSGIRPTDPIEYLTLKERASTILGVDEDDLVISYHEQTNTVAIYSTRIIRSLTFSESGRPRYTLINGEKNYKTKPCTVRFDQDEEVRFPTITFERDNEPAF